MSREELIKHKWKAYETIWLKHPRWEWAYEFMVAGIDFDDEALMLTPFEEIYDGYGKDGEWHGIQFCYFINPTPDKVKQITKV